MEIDIHSICFVLSKKHVLFSRLCLDYCEHNYFVPRNETRKSRKDMPFFSRGYSAMLHR